MPIYKQYTNKQTNNIKPTCSKKKRCRMGHKTGHFRAEGGGRRSSRWLEDWRLCTSRGASVSLRSIWLDGGGCFVRPRKSLFFPTFDFSVWRVYLLLLTKIFFFLILGYCWRIVSFKVFFSTTLCEVFEAHVERCPLKSFIPWEGATNGYETKKKPFPFPPLERLLLVAVTHVGNAFKLGLFN